MGERRGQEITAGAQGGTEGGGRGEATKGGSDGATKGRSDEGTPARKYSIMVLERGPRQQEIVADRIEALGGEVFTTIPEGFRLEAFLSLDQLRGIVAMHEIMFIDIRGEMELDMDIGRALSGADFEQTPGGSPGRRFPHCC